jgi:hypothetical protein
MRNKVPHPLERRFDIGVRYDLLDLTAANQWVSRFELSAIGFNLARNRAVVYLEFHRGRFGTGGIRFLVKRNGKWARDPAYGPGRLRLDHVTLVKPSSSACAVP